MGGIERPTLVFLHALGSSASGWGPVIDRLADRFDCRALDLPGFGDASGMGALTVEQTLDWLSATIRDDAPANWMVVGHSMGGKFATLLAARAEAGAPGLSGLIGVVLVAGSPPEPEPLDDDRRATMIGWFADGAADAEAARAFVDGNTADGLPDGLDAAAMADMRRSDPDAWIGWLTRGAREDWSAAAGRIAMPALLIAGAEDGDLGEANQRALNLPHYADARIEVIADAAHMLPYEQPDALAGLIAAHWDRVRDRALPEAFARIVASDRTSGRTRVELRNRLAPPEARWLDEKQRATLDALVDGILPCVDPALRIAQRVEAALGADGGDGWRFAALPADANALRQGVDTLAAVVDFTALAADDRGAWLDRMAAGGVGSEASGLLTGDRMRLWFEDVRAAAVRAYVAHPRTMARIGYDGIANGGDGLRKQGYLTTRAGEREAWQPEPAK